VTIFPFKMGVLLGGSRASFKIAPPGKDNRLLPPCGNRKVIQGYPLKAQTKASSKYYTTIHTYITLYFYV